MCSFCFEQEIKSFITDKPYLILQEKINKKMEQNMMVFIELVIPKETPTIKIFGIKFITRFIPTYDLYQCLKCNQYWMLSAPENAWRGFFKKR